MPSILIADDDQATCKLLMINLLSEGHDVDFVHDGREAFEYLNHSVPELVILDINMPFIGGLALCQAMRTKPDFDATSIIVLSAQATKRMKHEVTQAGADLFLTKPFSRQELLYCVRDLLFAPRLASA